MDQNGSSYRESYIINNTIRDADIAPVEGKAYYISYVDIYHQKFISMAELFYLIVPK